MILASAFDGVGGSLSKGKVIVKPRRVVAKLEKDSAELGKAAPKSGKVSAY